jgi:6-phosphogluconolactonase
MSRKTRMLLGLMVATASGVFSGCDPGSNQSTASYVYVVSNLDGPNAIEAFRRDRSTGELTRMGRFPTQGQGAARGAAALTQKALVSDGKFIFAVNPGSNTVSSLRIEQDGSLVVVDQQPTDGQLPATLAISRDLLYVGNSGHAPGATPQMGSYKGFRVRSNGTLQSLTCPKVDAPVNQLGSIISALTFNADATVLVASVLLANLIESYRVDSQGCLTDRKVIPGGGGPFSAVFRPNYPQQLVITKATPQFYPNEEAPGVASYTVDSNATLTTTSVYTDPDGSDLGLRDPCWHVYSPDGQRFWTSSLIPRTLNLFELDAAGRITRRSEFQPGDFVPDPNNVNAQVIVGSVDIAMDPQGKFIYQLRASSPPEFMVPVPPSIWAFEITGNWSTNAGLRQVQRLDLPTDLVSPGGPIGIIVIDR